MNWVPAPPHPPPARRDCIKRTLDERGLPHLGELCLANARDLPRIIQWNHEHGIRLSRCAPAAHTAPGWLEARLP